MKTYKDIQKTNTTYFCKTRWGTTTNSYITSWLYTLANLKNPISTQNNKWNPSQKHIQSIPPHPYATINTIDGTSKEHTNFNSNTVSKISTQIIITCHIPTKTNNTPQWNTFNEQQWFHAILHPEKHQHFTNILNTNFHQDQMKDTRFIPPPQNIHLYHIHINECNPKDDITYTQNIIQTQHNTAHIYDNTRRHMATISKLRLKWLWNQYHLVWNRPYKFEPPTQPFETKIIWLYKKYKFKTPKNDP